MILEQFIYILLLYDEQLEYYIKYRYSVVRPEHLWNSFDNAIFNLTKSSLYNDNILTIMNSWTEQSGYPVVNIIKKYKTLFLTQVYF